MKVQNQINVNENHPSLEVCLPVGPLRAAVRAAVRQLHRHHLHRVVLDVIPGEGRSEADSATL